MGRVKGVTWEDISMEELTMREENFHKGGDFLALLKKNNEKINKKNVFNWM